MAEELKTTVKNNKSTKKGYIFTVGRRKEAVARVRLHTDVKPDMTWNKIPVKKGDIIVNEMSIAEYFPSDVMRRVYSEPLRVADAANKFTFTISVSGGGQAGQLEAVVAGISRALAKLEPEEYRSVLKKKGFLTRDPRTRERRKVGTGGKARRTKQSPKR